MRFKASKFTAAVLIVSAVSISSRADDATNPPASTQPAVVKWEEAAKHVGETVTVIGPVKGTHVTTDRKSLVLNIGKDYPDPTRFSILITLDDKKPATEESFKGKTVKVTGKIELYRKAAEVRVKQADVTIQK